MNRWQAAVALGLVALALGSTAAWPVGDTEVLATDCGIAAGRDTSNNTVICTYGLRPEDLREVTEAAVRGATSPLTATIVTLSKQLGVTETATKSLLRIVGQQDVPLERLGDALAKVANDYQQLQAQLATFNSDNPTARDLVKDAEADIAAGHFTKAHQLLQAAALVALGGPKAEIAEAILSNTNSFVKISTEFGEMIEVNSNVRFRLRNKELLIRQIEYIDKMIELFPNVRFINGSFFLPIMIKETDESNSGAVTKMNQWESDVWGNQLSTETLYEFQRALDDVEAVFDKNAPRINGLGRDMVQLFKQGMALRQALVSRWLSSPSEVISYEDMEKIHSKLSELDAVERRLLELRGAIIEENCKSFDEC